MYTINHFMQFNSVMINEYLSQGYEIIFNDHIRQNAD